MTQAMKTLQYFRLKTIENGHLKCTIKQFNNNIPGISDIYLHNKHVNVTKREVSLVLSKYAILLIKRLLQRKLKNTSISLQKKK